MTTGNNSNGYGYVFSNNKWSGMQGLTGYPIGIAIAKDVVGFLTSGYVYIYNKGQWKQPYTVPSSETHRTIISKSGYVFVITSSACYTFNSNTNIWQRQPLSGSMEDYTH